MTIDEEPTQVLPDGTRVLTCIADLVRELLATGHVIVIDPYADNEPFVTITPPVPMNTWHMLDANWHDVAAILDVCPAYTAAGE